MPASRRNRQAGKLRRKSKWGRSINDGTSAKMSPTSSITVGGLVVDEIRAVLSNEGGKVPDSMPQAHGGRHLPHYYVSGLSLGDCVYSPRAAETIGQRRCSGARLKRD
jgi:hypothetical protein